MNVRLSGEWTILLIEDNPKDEALILHALKKHNIGNDVVVARGGAEAIEQLFGSSDEGPKPAPPQLVPLDLKLLKINGLDVLRRIRSEERTTRLPVSQGK